MDILMFLLMLVFNASKWVYGYINDVINVSITC
jgi:hypothetical protein